MRSKDLFPAVFSRHAAAYASRHDEIWRRGGNAARARLLDAAAAGPGARVAALACGPGDLGERLRDLVSPAGLVVGVDLAPGMLRVARRRSPGAALVRADVERLPFPDASFDAAVCGHGLQFVPDLSLALSEARRILRPGGRFAASVPAGAGSGAGRLLDSVFDRLLPPAPVAEDRDSTLRVLADPEAWTRSALDAGFRSASVEAVESAETHGGPDEMVARASGWWSCAMRLEAIPASRRRHVVEQAAGELERRLGPGPVTVTGRSLVLFAQS